MKFPAVRLLALILVFQLVCHLLLLQTIFINDEGTFLSAGWLMTRGQVPYRDFFFHHTPLVSAIAAFSFSLLGPELYAAKLLLAACSLLTTLLVFFITKRLFGEKEALVASAFFALMAPSFGTFMFLAEPFMAPLALLLFYSLFEYDRDGGKKWAFASGVICSLLFLVKQTGGIFLFASLLFILIGLPLGKRKELRKIAGDVSYLLLGFIIPLLLLLLVLTSFGALNQFYMQAIYYNLFVLQQKAGFQYNQISSYLIVLAIPLFLLPQLISSLRKGSRTELLLFIITLVAMNSVFLRFSYFRVFMALPLLAVMLGMFSAKHLKGKLTWFASGFAVLFSVVVLISCFQAFSNTSQQHISHITSNTAPGDRILAVPFGSPVYLLAKREPGYRYLGLGPWGQFEDTETNAIADLERTRPALVVYSKFPQWGKNFSQYEPMIDAYIWEHYEPFSEDKYNLYMVPKKNW